MEASASLLITQYRDSPNLKTFIGVLLAAVENKLMRATQEIERMRDIDSAEGVWLDYIGERMGVTRPLINSNDSTFGFDLAGSGFNQDRIKDSVEFDSKVLSGDEIYRKILKARSVTYTGYSKISDLENSIQKIDSRALAFDNNNMGCRITTDDVATMKIAKNSNSLAITAGVNVSIVDKQRVGFDNAGRGFGFYWSDE